MKKHKRLWITIISIVSILAIAAAGTYFYINSKLSKINHVSINKSDSAVGIDNSKISDEMESDYQNILLLGIDARNFTTDEGRSDSVMVLTIDKKHKKIKVTSLLRDMVLNMKGQGPMEGLNQDRLGHTYAYGGAQLSIKTVNENFNLNIRDFVLVDFTGIEKIVDAVGGVDINVSKEEISNANSMIREVAKIENKKPTLITKSGMQTLNGIQAMGYSRIRHVGNGDVQRTERQRTVLEQVFNKLTKLNLSDIPSAADEMLPYVKTSFTKNQLLSLGTYIITNKVKTFEQCRLPLDKTFKEGNLINNVYFVVWDRDTNINALHKFIFEEDANK